MADILNDILSRTPAGGTALLPAGEFEGPIYITKPLRLVGNNTTVWTRHGSVIEVTCAGAAIEGIRAENTESDCSGVAILARYGAIVKDVEVFGAVQGFGNEDRPFRFPRLIDFGSFAAGQRNSCRIIVNMSTDADIICNTAGLSFSPSHLTAGDNEITITAEDFSANSILYAEVLVKTQFTRRCYIKGRAENGIPPINGKLLYEYYKDNESSSDVISAVTSIPIHETPRADLRKGQRLTLQTYVGTSFDIRCSHYTPGIEIDPYVFLLDDDSKAFGYKGMIFFGNDSSENGSVRYHANNGLISIDLEKIDYRVKRVIVTYSIYEDLTGLGFAQVRSPRIALEVNGSERVTYNMYNIGNAPTVMALEFYKYNEEWRVYAAGMGYNDGMVKLCNRFGISVID